MARLCRVGSVVVGQGRPLTIIAGPCALESRSLAMEVGQALRDACCTLGLTYIFKASFDKANRTSLRSPRGPGLEQGLEDLAFVRDELHTPVTTDIHHPQQAPRAAEVVDLLQIPAFLCRQTDLLLAAGEAAAARNRAVNIKKGQFLSPREMAGPVEKVQAAGCRDILLTERGTFFGYHRLVNDFAGFGDLLELEAPGGSPPVCFDCTHSTQAPGEGRTSGGRPERAGLLAKAATAAGAHAIFLECHPDPPRALSDSQSMLPLTEALSLLPLVAAIRSAVELPASTRGGDAAEQRPSQPARCTGQHATETPAG